MTVLEYMKSTFDKANPYHVRGRVECNDGFLYPFKAATLIITANRTNISTNITRLSLASLPRLMGL